MRSSHRARFLAGCLGALLAAGCGGGTVVAFSSGSGLTVATVSSGSVATLPIGAVARAFDPASAAVSRVVVGGDSLADVGTFGFKFTVQDSANPAGFPIFPELVGAAYGVPATCSYYIDNGAGGVIARGNPACTNFAVAGGLILNGEGPKSIPAQLHDAATVLGGYGAGDLVLVDGGGNDAAAMALAYLIGATSRTGLLAFIEFVGREVDVGRLLAMVPGNESLARSANLYMEKAADTLADAINAEVLARGATRVAVLNVPDITLTPHFNAAFARVAQEGGAEEAVTVQAAVRQAVGAYNARLQSRLGGDPRIVLVDVRSAIDDQLAHPSAWGLTDTTHAACPVTGLSSAGLPLWSPQTCTSAALDATPGTVPGWWTTWAFADGFHPTPLGHRLLADTVNRALAAASAP